MDNAPENYLPTKNIAFAIASVARNTPNKIALIDNVNNVERCISYSSLEKRIIALTSSLAKKGIQASDTVAIISHNRIEIVEILLASMRLGAVPFVVNPGQSAIHISHILTETKARCIFFESTCPDPAKESIDLAKNCQLISIGSFSERIESYDQCLKAEYCLQANDLYNQVASIFMFTSGSTGLPKGVKRPLLTEYYSALSNTHISGLPVYKSPDEVISDPVIVSVPMFHSTPWSLWPTGLGRTTILLRYFDPKTFLTKLSSYKIIYTLLLPSSLALCLNEKTLIQTLDFSHLRLILLFGAPCSAKMMKEAQKALNCKTISGFGMTEGGPDLSFKGVDPEHIPVGSVGRATDNASVKLIDASGSESDFGELWFKNSSLFEGYLNQKQLTQSKFKDGWFKTGDIFYRDPDGFYFFRGRNDDMFLCDSENIYPLEIENILSGHESVLQACVVPLDDSIHGQVPAAMVVCRAGHDVSTQELRKYYLQQGPLNAYPRLIHKVDILPTLGPGKVNRSLVIEILNKIYQENAKSYFNIKNENCLEDNTDDDILEFVIETWKNILKINHIEHNTDLFALGVNSLQATIFVEKIKERFQISASLENMFELQTPDEAFHYIQHQLKLDAIAQDGQKTTGHDMHTIII